MPHPPPPPLPPSLQDPTEENPPPPPPPPLSSTDDITYESIEPNNWGSGGASFDRTQHDGFDGHTFAGAFWSATDSPDAGFEKLKRVMKSGNDVRVQRLFFRELYFFYFYQIDYLVLIR